MSDSNVRKAVSYASSLKGEVGLTWGSSEPRRHHIKVRPDSSPRAVRAVLSIDGEETVSRRTGTVFHYLHEAPGGRTTSYTVRMLDDNDELVASYVSVELRDSSDYPVWNNR